jgi:ABC-2 type transport system ATP-binding protein
MECAAEFDDVTKVYRASPYRGRAVEALRGVSFSVGPGEAFALLGPNRAGKTTLLKILLGLCRPGGGRVRRLGRPIAERATLARVGFMHESQSFPGYDTAAGLLEFHGGLCGIARPALRRRVDELLGRVGLADRAGEPIARFSKGMLRRLALAQALLAEPDLLVLDEPMEGLDLAARLVLDDVVAERRRAGKTAIIVSHALDDVARICDRAAVLVDGRLAHVGPLDALLRDPADGTERSLEVALASFYRPADRRMIDG